MSDDEVLNQKQIETVWRTYLLYGDHEPALKAPWYTSKRLRPFIRLLPSDPRCKMCYYPFSGFGGGLMKHMFGIEPSHMNPHLCNLCEQFSSKHPGGAEVELSILFADVRGSTTMAENMKPAEFSRLIARFFRATTKVLYERGALVEKLAGDGITAFFTPGFSGDVHALCAVESAREIIKVVAHQGPEEPALPVGIGVHTGVAFVGSIKSESGAAEIAVLGDAANIGARLASLAGIGEILASRAAALAAGLEPGGYETRRLTLKGRSEPVEAWVLHG